MKGEFGETPNPLRQNPPVDENNNPEPEVILGEEDLITETLGGGETKRTIEVQEMGVIENLDGTPASMTAETATTTETEPTTMEPATEPMATESMPAADPAAEQMSEQTANPAAEQMLGQVVDLSEGQMTDPTARPMEQAAPAEPKEPKKKMKKSYFIAIIICLLVAVACGVTALLLLLNRNTGDPVAKAVEKLISGEAAENVALDGTLTLSPTETGTGLENIRLDISGAATASGKVHNFDLTAYINLSDGSSLSIDVSEIYTANEDLYLKVDGLADIFGTMATLSENEQLALISTAVKDIDGKWIQISEEVLEQLFGSDEDETECFANLYTGIENSRNSLQKLYNENSFIISDTEEKNLIPSKTNPVYLITIDTEKFDGFVAGAQNLSAISDFTSCSGIDMEDLTADSILEELSELGEIFVEIDDDYNFTRVYTVFESSSEYETETDCKDDEYDCDSMTVESSGYSIELDLALSYPTTINISEPDEYTDFITVFNQLFYGEDEEESAEV